MFYYKKIKKFYEGAIDPRKFNPFRFREEEKLDNFLPKEWIFNVVYLNKLYSSLIYYSALIQ